MMLSSLLQLQDSIMPRPAVSLASRVFGRLTVIERTQGPNRNVHYLCRCECGENVIVAGSNLTASKQRSCGCLQREHAGEHSRTHGRSRTPEYNIWSCLITRCENRSSARYADYGGRGVAVCQRWRNSFEAFFEDMGLRPSPQHSIDRFPDNDGPYSPENCRWATAKEQMRNKRNNRQLTFRGETLIVSEWAERIGIQRNTIHRRLGLGWTVEEALTTPVS